MELFIVIFVLFAVAGLTMSLAKQKQAKRLREEAIRTGVAPKPKCPRCHSESITAHVKGVSLGKAATGAFLLGPIGLAAGGLGSGKVRLTCLMCGASWNL